MTLAIVLLVLGVSAAVIAVFHDRLRRIELSRTGLTVALTPPERDGLGALVERLVQKGAHVLGPNGRPFTPDSIGMAVAMRDLKQHLRETGEIKGYNPGFTQADRSRFLGELDRLVRRAPKPDS